MTMIRYLNNMTMIRYLNRHRACTVSFTEDEWNSDKSDTVIKEMKDKVLFEQALKGRLSTEPIVTGAKSLYKIDHRYKAWKNNKNTTVNMINIAVSSIGVFIGRRKAMEKYKKGEMLDASHKMGQTINI